MNVINLFGGWVETVFILLIGLSIINREIRLHYKIEIYIIGLYGSFLLLILQDVSTLYFSLLFLIITLVIVINSFMGIKLSNAFFAVIVGASFLLVAENISIVFYHLLINFSQHNILINEEFRFYFIFIFTLFLLFNSYLLSLKLNTRFIIEFRFISKEKDNRVIQIGILIAFILTLITFILLVDVNQGRNMIVFGFVIATISSISFTHKIFQKKIKNNREEIYQLYDDEVKRYTSALNAQKHDKIHHFNAIQGMLVQKKYDECKKFIDDLLRKTIFSNETYPINSSAVQGLLLAFKEEAFNKGIEVDYEIRSSLSKANCNSLDLNCIIGNMLQNAIEDIELENKYPKIILLKTYEKNHRVFIKVTNYGDVKGFEEHVDKIFNKGYTTKVNKIKTNEGLGLFTVQKIIEENNSIIYPLIEGDTISFVVSFPIGGE